MDAGAVHILFLFSFVVAYYLLWRTASQNSSTLLNELFIAYTACTRLYMAHGTAAGDLVGRLHLDTSFIVTVPPPPPTKPSILTVSENCYQTSLGRAKRLVVHRQGTLGHRVENEAFKLPPRHRFKVLGRCI